MFEIQIGKLMVREVINSNNGKGESYEYANINNYSINELSFMGERLISDASLFISFIDSISRAKEVKGGKDYSSLEKKSFAKVLEIVNEVTNNKPKRHIAKEDKYQFIEFVKRDDKCISNEKLGELAWKYVYEDTDEYKTILKDDIAKIDKKVIWENIEDKEKGLIKNYLLNQGDYNGDNCDISNVVWDEITDAVDKILKKDLKYYYIRDGKWGKLSDLGKLIWNEVMKHDHTFVNIQKKVEEDESFESYMEYLAGSIIEEVDKDNNSIVSKSMIYEKLINEERIDTDRELYKEMIRATMEMCTYNLQHIAQWDEDYRIWVLIKNEEEYYDLLAYYAIEGVIEYEIDFSKKNGHDILNVHFKDVKDFRGYKPIVTSWFNTIDGYSNKETETITDMISVHKDGYYLGLGILGTGAKKQSQNIHIWDYVLYLINKLGYPYKKGDCIEEKQNSSIDIKFDSKLKVLNAWEEEGVEFFNVSCKIPYQDVNGKFNFANELKFKYDKVKKIATLLKGDIAFLIGVKNDDLSKMVSELYKCYTKKIDVKSIQ